jgi:hypothetical protein
VRRDGAEVNDSNVGAWLCRCGSHELSLYSKMFRWERASES